MGEDFRTPPWTTLAYTPPLYYLINLNFPPCSDKWQKKKEDALLDENVEKKLENLKRSQVLPCHTIQKWNQL